MLSSHPPIGKLNKPQLTNDNCETVQTKLVTKWVKKVEYFNNTNHTFVFWKVFKKLSLKAITGLQKLEVDDCFSMPCLNSGSCISLESGKMGL